MVLCHLHSWVLPKIQRRLIHIDLEPQFKADQCPDRLAKVHQLCAGVRIQQVTNEPRIKDAALSRSRSIKQITGIGVQVATEPLFDGNSKAVFRSCDSLW